MTPVSASSAAASWSPGITPSGPVRRCGRGPWNASMAVGSKPRAAEPAKRRQVRARAQRQAGIGGLSTSHAPPPARRAWTRRLAQRRLAAWRAKVVRWMRPGAGNSAAWSRRERAGRALSSAMPRGSPSSSMVTTSASESVGRGPRARRGPRATNSSSMRRIAISGGSCGDMAVPPGGRSGGSADLREDRLPRSRGEKPAHGMRAEGRADYRLLPSITPGRRSLGRAWRRCRTRPPSTAAASRVTRRRP